MTQQCTRVRRSDRETRVIEFLSTTKVTKNSTGMCMVPYVYSSLNKHISMKCRLNGGEALGCIQGIGVQLIAGI